MGEKREQKMGRKKTSAPRKERGEGKAKKKTKLPGQPKRPMSAYFLWLNSEGRDKIKEENPSFGVTEVSKKAGEMWAKIDSDTKERFEKKAKVAKEKYEEEYKEWFEGGGEDALKAQKKEKKAEKKASGSSPKKSPKKKSGASSNAMSGKGFKSAEYSSS